MELNNSLVVSPNPSSGKFNLMFLNNETQIKSVEIYNSIGQKVVQENFNQALTSCGIDISAKANGIYFVCIYTEKGMARKKVIIQK